MVEGSESTTVSPCFAAGSQACKLTSSRARQSADARARVCERVCEARGSTGQRARACRAASLEDKSAGPQARASARARLQARRLAVWQTRYPLPSTSYLLPPTS